MLWTVVFSYPLMAVIQEISARIGRVTGAGIAGNIRRYYSKPILYIVVSLLLVANICNLGADIDAMGAVANLLLPGPYGLYVVVFGAISLLLQILVPYSQYVKYLKWLTVVLFAYVITAIILKEPKLAALHATFLPSLSFHREYFTALIAVLGTTISPYLFFWQASEEVEEVTTHSHQQALMKAPDQGPEQLQRIRFDTYFGMAVSNLVAFFVILTAAATLHTHGVLDIQTASQAAKALEPLAGKFAFVIFALGIIGTGLLAVPVLGRLCRLRIERSLPMESQPAEKTETSGAFLRHHRRCHLHWTGTHVCARQSNESTGMVSGIERRRRCSGDGDDDDPDAQQKNHGEIYSACISSVGRMARDCRDASPHHSD